MLDRYTQAARANQADLVVRICSDCPLFDPAIADAVIAQALQQPADWTSNVIQRSLPRGMEVEVCSMQALEQAHREGSRPEEHKEHVTPYLYRHPELFSLSHYVRTPPLPTTDYASNTRQKLELIKNILGTLYPIHPQFTVDDVVKLLEQHPEWVALNAHVQQKSV